MILLSHSVYGMTDKCGKGRRPTLAGMGKGDPLEVINFLW